jgi:hypothetical protein
VTIRDNFDRLQAKTAGVGSHGDGDVMGDLAVHNPHGCWHTLGSATATVLGAKHDGVVLFDVRVGCIT